ncbi:lipoate--protein ligase family protein [Rhabdothermincola sp.]|uniref:lipoate--protein ligase family protein n=1 Tax=Rhabdothermincola sp. TaxID=2820405 RepID=UPI002FE14F93
MAATAVPQTWRYLDLGRQGPYENASVMPVLARSVAEGSGPIAQTSVWGSTHLNVGWFDDVDATLDLERCRELGVEVVRRQLYGGGTAFYGAGCAAMWGFLLPKDPNDRADLDALLARFQPVLLDALARIGLGEVGFEGSSDLRWHGRKLGALTAQDVMVCTSVGGFLNLAKPDIDLYLQVVRIPDEKFKDKAVKDMREYVCTAEEVAGHPVTYEDFRDALLGALTDAGVRLEPGGLTEGEQYGLSKISARVGSEDAIRRVSSSRFREAAPAGARVGFGNHKGRKLCRAGVALDERGVIVAAMMAGDMHVSPGDVMDRVAAALVGAGSNHTAGLRERIAGVFEAGDVHQADAAMGVTTDDLLAALRKAIEDAEAAG